MSSWNLTPETIEQWEAVLQERLVMIQKLLSDGVLKYFESFEPDTHKTWFKNFARIDRGCETAEDFQALIADLDKWMVGVSEKVVEVNVVIGQDIIKLIHAELGKISWLGDWEYRKILMDIAGQKTSKGLKLYEARLVVRAIVARGKAGR